MRVIGLSLGVWVWMGVGCASPDREVDGPQSTDTTDTTDSTVASCGDGIVAPSEACDLGADNADDGACSVACEVATCGDGRVWAGEEACDDGADNANDAACTATCAMAVCGDGLVHADVEDCDDSNATPHDGCSPACKAPEHIDLSLASLKVSGVRAGDTAGARNAVAPDTDGDGLADLFLASGEIAYLLHEPALLGTQVDVTAATAAMPFEAAGDAYPSSVSGAGDVNGDGVGDLIVGTGGQDRGGSNAGVAYVIYGPVTGAVDLSQADAILVGEHAGDNAGGTVAGAGDMNGDGYDDVIVSASGYDGSSSSVGAVYVVFGPIEGVLSLADADLKLVGEGSHSVTGSSVSGAGDVDGDGLDDLIIGAPRDDRGGYWAGVAYLVRGGTTGTLSLANAHATFVGEVAGDVAGSSVAGVGDVDGDGFDDVLIGAPEHQAGGDSAGVAYLVRGPVSGEMSLATADAKLMGRGVQSVGYSVAPAGDFNGDGLPDVIVGGVGDNVGGESAGAAYVVLAPITGTIDVDLADDILVGEEAGDQAGIQVAGGGDVDGDGLDDVIVGANHHNAGGLMWAGAAYVIYGRP